jgi:uncharacterized membrane protein YjgN (DUF898 family)
MLFFGACVVVCVVIGVRAIINGEPALAVLFGITALAGIWLVARGWRLKRQQGSGR